MPLTPFYETQAGAVAYQSGKGHEETIRGIPITVKNITRDCQPTITAILRSKAPEHCVGNRKEKEQKYGTVE
jgi:hypothetical protein